MINTKSVIQVLVNIEGITSVQVLKDKLQSAIGNVSIVRYSVTPKHAIMYIEVIPTKGLVTFELEVDGKEFSLINVVEDIVKENPSYTEGSVQEAFAEQKSDEPLAAMAIIFDRDPQIDYLLTKEFKLGQLSTYDGLVSISTENGLVLIEKQCNVVIDYSTYNQATGTVRLLQTSRSEEPETIIPDDELTEEQIQEIRDNLKAVRELTIDAEKNAKIDAAVRHEKEVQEMRNILDAFSDENYADIVQAFEELEAEVARFMSDDVFLVDNIKISGGEYLEAIKAVMETYNIEDQNLAEFVFDFDLQESLTELQKSDRTEQDILKELMISVREVLGENLTMDEALRMDLEGTEIPVVQGASEPTHPGSPRHPGHEDWLKFIDGQPTDRTSQEIANLISDLDAIANDKPYKLPERTLSLLTGRERDIAEMQKLLDVMKVDGEATILGGSKIRLADVDFEVSDNNTYTATAPDAEGHEELSEEELAQFSIGDTVIETIELKVALISFGSFDEYAASHNIVGWDLFTPTTVLIKYMEGSNTPIEKIQKFHDMMNSLDTGWIEKPEQPAITAKFVSELNQVLDRDVVQEFLNRVQKHNTFVRESTAKIRKALLDMEQDFNALKDEVNLIIDWEDLTAHASRKERTETRISGVKKGVKLDVENNNSYSLVKVIINDGKGDFFIPLSLVTDEIRSNYELDDYYYYIEHVPNFAFYEVPVNGHVMLIEKTDL